MTASNMFNLLPEEVDGKVNVSAIPSKKLQKVLKKATKKKAVKLTVSLKDDMADFERENPVGIILYHYKKKDQFLVFNFKFSHLFYIELSARGVKKVSTQAIERVINEKAKKPNNVVVWYSYVEETTLKRLTDQEYFTAPSEFKNTFDLVRGEPVSNIRYSNVIVFDFRVSNSGMEFMYRPDGSRVYFGKTYDEYRVSKNRDKLLDIEKQFERSLDRFDLDEVYDARDEIFRLTDDPDYRDFAYEAERFIAKYVHIHDPDEEVELRNLLQFRNWTDDLRIKCDRALDYRDGLFDLLKKLRERAECERECLELKNKALELKDEEAYPSL